MQEPGTIDEPLLISEKVSLLSPSTASKRNPPLTALSCRRRIQASSIFLLVAIMVAMMCNSIYDRLVDREGTENDSRQAFEPGDQHCFERANTRVVEHRPGFPSFWNYAHQGPIRVSYDERAIKLNGDRSFFLGGSFHPSRATKMTWDHALDEAVHNGLNLITIYVMWSAHQKMPGSAFDWGFPGSYGVECDGREDPSCGWNLAAAIRAAADRGLFVHLRVGPYDCAEYSYGGIPEWLALHKPQMEMRRPNREWLEVMREFVSATVTYISNEQLWAHQGGNIILAQIENELGAKGNFENPDFRLLVDEDGNFVDPGSDIPDASTLRNASIQDYADWCGDTAEELAPNVTWTMCNGLYANNTILTCNAVADGHKWLEKNGGENGRIQIDQPALLTEFEGGFQTWGSTADKPLDYFWGRTARDMTRDALKWFARGGCHLNYYMFFGSYNRQRQAAAGITNMYANEAPLCSSGQPRQPKFGHFQALHKAITDITPTLLNSPSALGNEVVVKHQDNDGSWKQGGDQRAFLYHGQGLDSTIIFLENDSSTAVLVEVPLDKNPKLLTMHPNSAVLLVNGLVTFDSASINPTATSFERKFLEETSLPILMDWETFEEPIGTHLGDVTTWTGPIPIEQTRLNADSGVSSDYAWYETNFYVDLDLLSANLFIETQMASAFVVFIDNQFCGSAYHHLKKEGPISLEIEIGTLAKGKHRLQILSESLGYINLIGRWGGTTLQKTKGLTGDILLSLGSNNISLVDGRVWKSHPGLHGEAVARSGGMKRESLKVLNTTSAFGTATWSSTLFETPPYDPTFQTFAVKINRGRGHLWLNGRDLGRYWNITRGECERYSQEKYFLPHDFLRADGSLNELIFFNPFEEIRDSVRLEVSWVASSDSNTFEDEVDYRDACLN